MIIEGTISEGTICSRRLWLVIANVNGENVLFKKFFCCKKLQVYIAIALCGVLQTEITQAAIKTMHYIYALKAYSR